MRSSWVEHVIKIALRASLSLDRPILERTVFQSVSLLGYQIAIPRILNIVGTVGEVAQPEGNVEFVTLRGLLLQGFAIWLSPVFVHEAPRSGFTCVKSQILHIIWLISRLQCLVVHAELVASLHVQQNQMEQEPESEKE